MDQDRFNNQEPLANQEVSSSIDTPLGVIESYYCGVLYRWYAGSEADDMSVTDNTTYRRLIGGTYAQECSVVSVYNPSICPCWHNNCAASYSSSTDEYSDIVSIEDFNLVNHGSFGRSILTTTKYLVRTAVSSIPNQIDQDHFIWDHDGSSSNKIYATIEYNNEMIDVVLNIPLFGYRSATFSVGGQSFTMRTGPRRVSIKADASSNIPLNDFCFAFRAYSFIQ